MSNWRSLIIYTEIYDNLFTLYTKNSISMDMAFDLMYFYLFRNVIVLKNAFHATQLTKIPTTCLGVIPQTPALPTVTIMSSPSTCCHFVPMGFVDFAPILLCTLPCIAVFNNIVTKENNQFDNLYFDPFFHVIKVKVKIKF